jgi:flagellar biosynthesis/type III secretory pathway M-ring protein FliF/YscJ
MGHNLSEALAAGSGAAAERAAQAAGAPPAPVLPLPGATGEPAPDQDAIEEVRRLASDMASNEPEAAARVLRGWLAEANASGNKDGHA